MNATQALARLNERPSSPELREQHRAARMEALATKRAAEAAAEERRKAILDADAEYQRLKSELVAARRALDQTHAVPYYRYTAGTCSSLFFSVAAEGDNLAELVDKVAAKQQRERQP